MTENKSGIITIFVIILILVGVGIFTFSSRSGGGDGSTGTERDRVLSESGYLTLRGDAADFSQYEGKVQVVNSWATWCPFCVQELPDFAELASEYEDKGVVVISINRKEDPRNAQAFIDSLGGLEGIEFFLDPKDQFYDLIGGFSMPETIFYDREGNVVIHKRGIMGLAEMRQHVEAALATSETNG